MLDFGFSEILLTSAIALVVLGPERLPKVARQVGNWMGRARAMARQLSEQLEREVSADELLKEQTKPSAGANRSAPPSQYAAPLVVPPYAAPDQRAALHDQLAPLHEQHAPLHDQHAPLPDPHTSLPDADAAPHDLHALQPMSPALADPAADLAKASGGSKPPNE